MVQSRGSGVPASMLFLLLVKTFQLSSQQQNAPGYIGCFKDTVGSRAFPVGPETSGSQSVEWCFRFCLEMTSTSYVYAGLEFYDECFCGNNEIYGRRSDSQCLDRCEGNNDQICGDSNRLSVYRITRGVCSNDIGPPTNGSHTITNPRSLSYNLNNFKLYGTRVDFYCDTGFTLQGASSIQCITQYNRAKWSGPVPTCQESTTDTDSDITASMSTTAELLSTTTFDQTTNGLIGTMTTAPPSVRTSTKATGTVTRKTSRLETVSIIGIVAGAVLLTALVGTAMCLVIKRRKRRSDIRASTGVLTFTNNSYAVPVVPENIVKPNEATSPVYSQVIKKHKPENGDVNATLGDVTNMPTNERPPSSDVMDSSSNALIYENALFATTQETANNDSYLNRESSGPLITMKGKPGWVENIIYE